MIGGIIRFFFFFCLLINTYYLINLDHKISDMSSKLNINVHNIDMLTFLKQVGSDVEEQLENQRDRVRKSLENKGIEERNRVLIRSRREDTTEVDSN